MRILTAITLFIAFTNAFGQSTNIPLDDDYYHLIERYEILDGEFADQFNSSIQPIQRINVAAFVDEMLADSLRYFGRDKFNLLYLANDNWEYSKSAQNVSKKDIFNLFYKKKSDLLFVKEKDFDLHINPVFHFSGGTESASDVTTYANTRGLKARGSIANKVGFYSYITTTQTAYPRYVRDYVSDHGVVPSEGFWKLYNKDGYDFFTARGYLSFNLIKDYVNAQFGYDKNNWGTGHRSMLLSDFSNAYTFLKLNTRIWRINYTNLFTQLTAEHFSGTTGSSGVRYPKKFMTAHHLSIDLADNFRVGLFEAVVSGDSTERFNIDYINPIIFYRALEHQGGSVDNAMVGFDFDWIIGLRLLLYGQLMLDEFKLDEITSGNGWWANKFGVQGGIKYINFLGIPNMDAQLEYNLARPYLYQHQDIYTSYTHYSMPMAHPIGGNFKELVAILRYQPFNRFYITAQLNIDNYGEDEDEATNWGKDPTKSYVNASRTHPYGNTIGQGIDTNLFYGDLTLSYQIKHNIFIDVRAIYRKLQSADPTREAQTTYFSTSLRWNMPRISHDF